MKAEKAKYKDVDFDQLSNADQDNDGIKDLEDNCPRTPSGVKVDKFGCALDDDNDGVANYLDQQKNTPTGAVVNEFGIEINDSIINARLFLRDSIETERNKMFSDSSSTGRLHEILNSDYKLNDINPEIKQELTKLLSPADQNNDGRISKDEITIAIDGFFDGNNSLKAENIYDLIDYYFDQN